MAATTSVAKSAQNASEIGWAFVPQYYTFVNRDPSRLHCFYTKRSTLIHSTEGEEANPCFGQQEIHEKFMSLNFDDCKVFVSNVDSQSSADGGIIVQVLGEMSNGAGPWRKFAQTFFLAEQPNGFFVLNDIFRYIKDEAEDGDEEPEAEPVTVTEDVAMSDSSLAGADAVALSHKPGVSSETLPVAAAQSHGASSAPAARSTTPLPADSAASRIPVASAEPAGIVQTFGSSQVNGFHPDPVDVKPPEAATEPVKAAAKPQEQTASSSDSSPPVTTAAPSANSAFGVAAGVNAAQPPTENVKKPETTASLASAAQPSGPSQAPSTNGRSASGPSKPSSTPAAPPATQTKPVETPPQPAAPPAPKTWASLAASGKSAWGQGHLASSQGVSTAPNAVSQSAADSPSQPPQQRPSPASHFNPVESVSTGACFIKSVHENLDEKSLREQLAKKFGPIKELDVIRNKACGFLEFQSVDSAKKAIQMSLPYNQGGKGGIQIVAGGEEFMIVIESKRQPGERGRPIDAGPKRGFGDRGARPGGGYGPTGRGRGGMDGPRGSSRGGLRGGGTSGGGRGMANNK